MIRAGLLAMFVVALAPAAHAQKRAHDPDVRPSFEQCMDSTGGSDGRILECIDVEATYQDGLLNQAYRATMARLPPPQRVVLRKSQRRWLNTRFDKCRRENGDPESGTMEHWTNNLCNLHAMIARTGWLRKYRP